MLAKKCGSLPGEFLPISDKIGQVPIWLSLVNNLRELRKSSHFPFFHCLELAWWRVSARQKCSTSVLVDAKTKVASGNSYFPCDCGSSPSMPDDSQCPGDIQCEIMDETETPNVAVDRSSLSASRSCNSVTSLASILKSAGCELYMRYASKLNIRVFSSYINYIEKEKKCHETSFRKFFSSSMKVR